MPLRERAPTLRPYLFFANKWDPKGHIANQLIPKVEPIGR